jgi:hypothetical protein
VICGISELSDDDATVEAGQQMVTHPTAVASSLMRGRRFVLFVFCTQVPLLIVVYCG